MPEDGTSGTGTERFECTRCGNDTFTVIIADGEWSFIRCAECDRTADLDYTDPDRYRTDGGDPRGEMGIKPHSGDPVREAINRSEYRDVKATGEVGGHEVLVHAYVNDADAPVLDVYGGGRWDQRSEEYVGGRVVTERFDRAWELDEAFGDLLREHDLDYVGADRDD